MVSMYKQYQPQEVTGTVLKTAYKDTLNLLLCKFCGDKLTKCDEKHHHNLQKCMMEGFDGF